MPGTSHYHKLTAIQDDRGQTSRRPTTLDACPLGYHHGVVCGEPGAAQSQQNGDPLLADSHACFWT
jgi:hypothetical protein